MKVPWQKNFRVRRGIRYPLVGLISLLLGGEAWRGRVEAEEMGE